MEGAMSSKVIAIGLDPSVVDYSAMPQFTPEMFRSYIEAQIERVRGIVSRPPEKIFCVPVDLAVPRSSS
jgi:hypothetical protein